MRHPVPPQPRPERPSMFDDADTSRQPWLALVLLLILTGLVAFCQFFLVFEPQPREPVERLERWQEFQP